MDRRQFMQLAGLAAVPIMAPRLVFGGLDQPRDRDVLVCIFQRGAADGLNMVVPLAEREYYALRPSLAVAEPGASGGALDLDGFFGLHPDLAPLLELYQDGRVGFVHAVGSPHESRSHFDAQDFMERGYPGKESPVTDGWLNRHLQVIANGSGSPFRGVGFGGSLQLSLRGDVPAVGLVGLSGFDLVVPEAEKAAIRRTVESLFSRGAAIDQVASGIFSSVDLLAESGAAQIPVENGAEYPDSPLGEQLAEVARLIRAGVGLEVACIDTGDWDHHEDEAARLSPLLDDLGRALAAFHTDLGALMDDVCLLTMTEFGRRVAENASSGTDHGHGSVMIAMGGAANGGAVYGHWPGLSATQLSRGDLEVTTDFRTVISDALASRLGAAALDVVFPDFEGPTAMGLFRSR